MTVALLLLGLMLLLQLRLLLLLQTLVLVGVDQGHDSELLRALSGRNRRLVNHRRVFALAVVHLKSPL